ncbi:NTPase KAP family P-loop domain-containing protein 1 [Anas platyrhynchos]|uniref:NTPase KAP family P-loop domain-containing protein 1 n=1 Tax=Anas platyrhynchos TaxID=8839 RepID=R0KJP6_ANAPL|nr:NTPase KAP family P-loop domain-containing protein 1 [Anas platyrhynchos]
MSSCCDIPAPLSHCPDIPVSRCRDIPVPLSHCHDIPVPLSQCHDIAASRCPHVVTSQCHNVLVSRRPGVTMSPCRDIPVPLSQCRGIPVLLSHHHDIPAARREERELQRGQAKPRSAEGWGLPLLLWYLAFYKPIITELHLRRKNIGFIFIRFSAWQYAGCDKLWAGLVTTLCSSVRHHFGALPLSVYHVMGARPRFASGFSHSQKEWVLKRGACLKLWGLLLVLGAGLGVLLAALLVPGLKEHRALKVVGSTVTSLSGSGLVLGALSVLKNLLVSEKQKIERLTNSEKFTSQLGFMSKVRGEVEVLIGFLAFMEIFERRRLRVVLEITSLDLCYPEKVAGVLNAMNTLLSDANAPFIFVLAVDPSVIVPCLEQTGCMKGLADNGYLLYLSRTGTLPPMGGVSRV